MLGFSGTAVDIGTLQSGQVDDGLTYGRETIGDKDVTPSVWTSIIPGDAQRFEGGHVVMKQAN